MRRRCTLQERLGLSFLPAFWRLGLSGHGVSRERVVGLALGELVTQYDRLAGRAGWLGERHAQR